MSHPERRLVTAVERGLIEPLVDFGYQLAGSQEGHRGSWVEISNGTVLITVTADWLEGELSVTLRAGADGEIPLDRLVAQSSVKGLHLSRLPRSVSAGILQSQLNKVAELLKSEAHDVLAATEQGLARLATVEGT